MSIPEIDDSIVDEKSGKDRLGPTSFLGNFGPSLILLTLIYGSFILVFSFFIWCNKRNILPFRCKKCVVSFQNKIYFNSLIAYL